MTNAVYDMQSEDAAVQSILWKILNVILAKHGVLEPKFKGFMTHSSQANQYAIWIIYRSGEAAISVKDQEKTCLFHRTQSLEKHTKANIRVDFQNQHQLL
jgi:hypothetical protein